MVMVMVILMVMVMVTLMVLSRGASAENVRDVDDTDGYEWGSGVT